MKVITDEDCCAYSAPAHVERPQRVSDTLEKLREQKELRVEWAKPYPASETAILRAHDPSLLERLKVPRDFDADTPYYPDIGTHARASAGAAIQAMQSARDDTPAFSLMRPPSHHATRNRIMGFCYLNSIAIATLEARATGTERIAVFDFDVHHGNGTEHILLNQPGTVFCSIHQHPCYPGTGTSNVGENCFNFPVQPELPRDQYRQVLKRAFESLQRFKPDLLAVSAGFDAYVDDPISQETLLDEDFLWLGRLIRESGIPAFAILEGGYSNHLPELIFAFLKGWEE